MAKAVKVNPVITPRVPPFESIDINLTYRECAALAYVTRLVGGHPGTSLRGLIDDIANVLERAGVAERGLDVPNAATGEITFKEGFFGL